MGRLLGEESGIAMGLAVILIVIIGVMGAGLLVFVRNDLEAVVEVNQGQRAFEMADAGVQAAEQRLESDESIDDTQWLDEDGVELRDFDQAGDSEDSVRVTIDHDSGEDEYTVISTGEYRDAKRRIEAVYASSGGSGEGGLPAYYAPGSIDIKNNAEIDGLSLFSGENINIHDVSVLGDSKKDPLGDWNRPPYNTVPRETSTGPPYTTGLAAEGYICESGSCDDSGDSVADGVTGYDSTTGDKGSDLQFVEKIPPGKTPNDEGTITYPFPRTPNVDGLLEKAQSGSNVYKDLSDGGSKDLSDYYDGGKPVVFIDAGGEKIQLKNGSSFKGALVVRCGDLDLKNGSMIEGIILVLKGEDPGCSDTGKISIKNSAKVRSYVYAGSTEDKAIEIKNSADIGAPEEDEYEEVNQFAYSDGLERQSWRELYK